MEAAALAETAVVDCDGTSVKANLVNTPRDPEHVTLGMKVKLATCIATVPYYYLNRMWVFKKSGRSHLTKEVLPFWTIAFVSLVLSTLAVKFAGSQVHAISSKNVRGAILVAANLATYGILWIAKFVVFNRILFKSSDVAE